MKEIVVDGIKYVPVKSDCPIRIVILQRGWVMVGRFERNGSDCKLHDAAVIRIWGTSKGLGELHDGPVKGKTVLDKTHGVVEFDYLTVVATVQCSPDWEKHL